jgi:dihydrodipicolinate synthase/N-acetylneuraminate lyase
MSAYDDLRRKIAGPMAPLPIFYKDDLGVDYDGIGKYTAWLVEGGIRNLCLTHGYSRVGFVTQAELIEVTRTIARVVEDRAVFIGCTRTDPVVETVESVRQIREAGAHAAFVMPQPEWQSGALFRDFLGHMAAATDFPLLFVSLPSPEGPHGPNLSAGDYELLLEHENIVGIKEDFNDIPYRMELIRRYGRRLCIIGGGALRNYLFVHRYPQQGELDGQFSPRTARRFVRLLDEGCLDEALTLIEQREAAINDFPQGLDWQAKNQVYLKGLGFAESVRMRPPIVAATDEQVRDVIQRMRKYPGVFEMPS